MPRIAAAIAGEASRTTGATSCSWAAATRLHVHGLVRNLRNKSWHDLEHLWSCVLELRCRPETVGQSQCFHPLCFGRSRSFMLFPTRGSLKVSSRAQVKTSMRLIRFCNTGFGASRVDSLHLAYLMHAAEGLSTAPCRIFNSSVADSAFMILLASRE